MMALCPVTQVDVVHPRCEAAGCTLHTTFGRPNSKRQMCAKHKLDGMVREGRASSRRPSACMSGICKLSALLWKHRAAAW